MKGPPAPLGGGTGGPFSSVLKISHVGLAIPPKMAGSSKIASEVAGYFSEKLNFEAIWSQ
ncbi:MAG: hypothetical protein J7639_33165 [Paenibacillaceae bacterium]|nr:hypothetical protein [Paenibacillaceae bacterium]